MNTDHTHNRCPIFIVGIPRSGTTLVQAMLNAHPKIVIAPETHFFNLCWSKRYTFGTLENPAARASLVKTYSETKFFKSFKFQNEEKVKSILNQQATSYKLFFELLLKEYMKKFPEKIVCGEKTPRHLVYIGDIKRMFLRSIFIHVIRDPRGVYNSFSKVKWTQAGPGQVALRWVRYMETAEKFKRKYPNDLLDIHFENLLKNPETELKKITDFASLEYDCEMLAYFEKSTGFIGDEESWKYNVKKPLDETKLYNWRKNLSENKRTLVTSICIDQMIAKKLIDNNNLIIIKKKKEILYLFLNQFIKIKILSKEMFKTIIYNIHKVKNRFIY